MPVLKRALTLMVIAVLSWGIFSVPVAGNSDSPSLPAAPDLVQQVVQSFDALTDYRCQMYSSRLRKDGTMAVDTNNYFFKKPKLIRLEVTSGGDKGSKVVLNKKGKVRAKAGGVLGVFTITMEPTDKRLQDGDSSFVTTDLGSTLKDLQLTMNGAKATVTLIEGPRRAYQLVLERPGKKDTILIDAELKLPFQWEVLRNGKFDSKTEWKNLTKNVGLADELFEL